jgi:hypothetical protein
MTGRSLVVPFVLRSPFPIPLCHVGTHFAQPVPKNKQQVVTFAAATFANA